MKRPAAAIRPEWFMSSEDAARATDALKKLRRHETRGFICARRRIVEIKYLFIEGLRR